MESLARPLLAHSNNIDLVVVTGDLAATGGTGDLEAAFDETLGGDEAVLKKAAAPILLIPGNHDRFHPRPPYYPGNKRFDKVFADYWTSGQGVGLLGVFEGGDERLAFIGADLTLRRLGDAGPGGHLGRGRVYQEHLERLSSETERAREQFDDPAIIWVIHFAPYHSGVKQSLVLKDDRTLMELATDLDVPMILCGHTHECREYSAQPGRRRPFVWCAGTTTQCGASENCFHIRRVHVDSGDVVDVDSRHFVWVSAPEFEYVSV